MSGTLTGASQGLENLIVGLRSMPVIPTPEFLEGGRTYLKWCCLSTARHFHLRSNCSQQRLTLSDSTVFPDACIMHHSYLIWGNQHGMVCMVNYLHADYTSLSMHTLKSASNKRNRWHTEKCCGLALKFYSIGAGVGPNGLYWWAWASSLLFSYNKFMIKRKTRLIFGQW
jgi:hypothetical protein